MKRETDEIIGRVNGKFATVNWTPIWYYYRSFDFDDLIDLYRLSDIAMVTPLRDGMNLVAKEYLATRINNDGVLILSELAGSSKELPQALLVNPFDIEQLSEFIKIALEMPLKEQKERNILLRKRIRRYDINKWSSSFMKALNDSSNKEYSSQVKLIDKSIANKISKTYKESRNKLLLLDYDGTMVGFQENPNKAIPTKDLLELIKKLTKKEDTDLVIISGRPYEFLEKYFTHLNVTLVAEHGVFTKFKQNKWEQKKSISEDWKEHLIPILDTFTDNTPGTFIEQKTSSVAWHYRKADPELGTKRSVELKTVLTSLLPNGLTLLDGNKVLELVPANINKGVVALDLLNSKDYDFILIDCPPSLGLLTLNVLVASNNVLIPIQSEFFALEGLKNLQETIRLVQDNMNNDLKILGILITMHTKRLRLARKVENLLKSNFKNKLLKTKISRNIRLAEAPDDGKPAIMYDVDCAGAKNYMELALEILNEKK